MAIYCIDYINGVDAVGRGTAALPYKTLKYTISQITTFVTGDEIRIHAGVAPTLLSSDCTQTASTTTWNVINTPVDLTGQLVVGDYIYIGNLDFPYRLIGVTSTQLTVIGTATTELTPPRFSVDGTATFSVWKAGGVPITFNAIGTSEPATFKATGLNTFSDGCIISGGWADGFNAKTVLGRTNFLRVGTSSSTTGVSTSHQLWEVLTSGFVNGFLFKDLQFTYMGMTTAPNTTIDYGCNYDNIWMAGSSTIVRLNNNGRVSGTNPQDFYATNLNFLHAVNSGNATYFIYPGANADTTLEYPLDFSGLTSTYHFINANSQPTWSLAVSSGGVPPIMTGAKTVNHFNPIFWGRTAVDTVSAIPAIQTPASRIPGQGSVGTTTFPDGQFILFDNIVLEGYPMQTVPRDISSTSFGSALIKFSNANLPFLISDVRRAQNRGFYGRQFIEAPIDPIELTANGAWPGTAATSTNIANTDAYTNIWTNNLTGKKFYYAAQNIVEIDTTDFSTGTNAIKMRPGAIAASFSTYGGSIRIADFRMGMTQTATVVVRMKTSGVVGTVPIQLWSLTSMGTMSLTVVNSVNANQFVANPTTANVTDSWADYTFTVTYPWTTPGIVTQSSYSPAYNLYIGEGNNASRLSQAGQYLHIDSVNITIS